ncbi:MAG: pyruvate kinase, partial [Candidatus Eisenbacteria bacterium]|nr:pyruvate kinase [Candidatus Eisenbacteria bacterium]
RNSSAASDVYKRQPRDVRELRRLQSEQGAEIPIVAKIEKREAIHELPQILEESDGVMVARGDLGVETDLEEVALRQKEIILACNREGKIVITATQMLESMITHPSPTRAEVSDVSNAVLDGTDAVMLSGETSVGTYPVETVAFMARIVERTEARFPRHLVGLVHPLLAEVPDAVAHAACTLAEEIRADALVCLTRSGRTAQLVSRYRPACPILALSPDAATVRRLAIVWGVEPMYGGPETASGDGVREAIECARATGRFRPGARIVITSGVRDGSLGGVTNSVRVESFP